MAPYSTPFAGMTRIRFVRSEAVSLPLSRVHPAPAGRVCSASILGEDVQRGVVGISETDASHAARWSPGSGRVWQIGEVTQSDRELDELVGEWLTLREAARPLGVSPNRIKTYIRENRLMGVVRAGELSIPAAFLDGDDLVKGLPGTIVLLTDAGFSTEEALRWLFTPDDTLPGTPIQAMRENRGTEVRRRAQSMAF